LEEEHQQIKKLIEDYTIANTYKPKLGDKVDEVLAKELNSFEFDMSISRLKESSY